MISTTTLRVIRSTQTVQLVVCPSQYYITARFFGPQEEYIESTRPKITVSKRGHKKLRRREGQEEVDELKYQMSYKEEELKKKYLSEIIIQKRLL